MFGLSSIVSRISVRENSLRSKLCKGILPVFLAVSIAAHGVPLAHAATAPTLGVASDYAVFGKTGVTNDGIATHIWGDVGADLLSNITGLTESQVDGTMKGAADVAGVQDAITTAYNDLAGQSPTGGALDLNGINIVTPGVYSVGATTLDGTLTLNGAGVYIFQSSSSINVMAGATVLLTNGATACNVFWQIPASMTMGAGRNDHHEYGSDYTRGQHDVGRPRTFAHCSCHVH